MKTYSKDGLISALKAIRKQGWIASARPGNAGSVGNTIEDLLGIEENNLPIPNASEWELKCQKKSTSSLVTLFHSEPSPRACRFVPQMLLPQYGWPHQEAGTRHPDGEMSFRQTINGLSRSDRGFQVVVDQENKKVMVSFDADSIGENHASWKQSIENRVGLGELNPQPYWGFDDLSCKAGTKLLNCFYLQAKTKKIDGKTHFLYDDILILEKFAIEKFINALKRGVLYVDFDARTGHNHGTKFRLKQNELPSLYKKITPI